MQRSFIVPFVCSLLAAGAVTSCSKKPETKSSAADTTSVSTLSGENLKPGDVAPDFTAKAQDGSEIHLAALKGKPVVVYFYPKDETPGCTKQACALRDAWNDLEKKGVVLIGVSADSDESHRAFIEHHKLPFRLVSDPDGKLASQFGVPTKMGFISRQTIVIDPDGKVKKIYRTVDVATHARDVLGDISS